VPAPAKVGKISKNKHGDRMDESEMCSTPFFSLFCCAQMNQMSFRGKKHTNQKQKFHIFCVGHRILTFAVKNNDKHFLCWGPHFFSGSSGSADVVKFHVMLKNNGFVDCSCFLQQ